MMGSKKANGPSTNTNTNTQRDIGTKSVRFNMKRAEKKRKRFCMFQNRILHLQGHERGMFENSPFCVFFFVFL